MKKTLDRLYIVSMMLSCVEDKDSRTYALLNQRFDELDAELQERYEQMDDADFMDSFQAIDEI